MSEPPAMPRFLLEDDRVQRLGLWSDPQRPYYTTPDIAGVPRGIDYLEHELDYIASKFTTPSRGSFRAPSLSSSTAAPTSMTESLFDQSSVYSSYGRQQFDTVTQASTAPSRRSHPPADVAWVRDQIQTGVLPCEFVGYASCNARFNLDETELWIQHIITHHLCDILPEECICWFCDDYKFSAKDNGVDVRTNFVSRMWHIRDHISGGKTAHDIRPDFQFLQHLYKYQLISKEMYHRACEWDERPPSYASSVYRHDYEPSTRLQEVERRNQVPHDLRKEERRNRKQHQHSQRRQAQRR